MKEISKSHTRIPKRTAPNLRGTLRREWRQWRAVECVVGLVVNRIHREAEGRHLRISFKGK